ncbi:MAG: bifunctional phosphopantothenoylcysteine decarboxylase/phosphopantothenate--cysteine ligase CoaBC [Leptolyngbya sp. SIO4C1]|nr:bifunctional phosphopantothenoylcysteine decarboxylase/phosphopantothenate--cysteine ligase CoaBC [Leptolyngbya sp. SIO4C1]
MKNEALRVLVGVTGGIAAYKLCEVVSTLAKSGAAVRVILTDAAQQFVSALTFATLARHPAYTDADFWSAAQGRPLHIELGEWADLFLIGPLTANTLGKLAHGLADNLVTNTVLASRCPILLAPAMNTDMWQQASVQRSWQRLLSDLRYHTVGPAAGRLACDRVGTGRMAEPAEILDYLSSLQHTAQRDLAGKHLLISTGGTREPIDPVRFIGNPATGRMGIALAKAACHRGARVTLVHAPLEPQLQGNLPSQTALIATLTAAEMEAAMLAQQPQADWVILAAAVADIRPQQSADYKLPKAELPNAIAVAPVPDIAAQLAAKKPAHQRLIGFAAQTGSILEPAKDKLMRKQLDAIVANPVDQANSGFGSDQNQAILIDRSGRQQVIEPTSKLLLAHRLYDFMQTLGHASGD